MKLYNNKMSAGATPLHTVASWPEYRWPWLLLAVAASALFITALIMQHGHDLNPCEQCIYQRTAMLGLALAGWLGVIAPQHWPLRLAAYAGWLYTAWAGYSAASYHLWLQREANPIFTSCAAIPSFPQWAPLHEWLPSVFAITGLCGDDGWRLLGLNMPEWLRIIFAIFLALAVVTLLVRLLYARKI